jgi:glucuronoarabinoxylan endo-1,4-beta-xylanase
MKTMVKMIGLGALMAAGWAGLVIPAAAQVCAVDWTDVHQRIDGFGASCSFSGRTWSDVTADTFFTTNVVGTNNGIALSLLRTQIQPGGSNTPSEFGLMKKAYARGVRVWSVPWTPQASYKSNLNTVGGYFSVTNYKAYASQLANYVKTNANGGLNLYAISIQNEPDANVTYVSCHWTPQQIHDFTTNLYNALVASNVVSTKIMLPESESWSGNTALYTTTLNDPNVAADVGIIANHNYVANNLIGDQNPPAAIANYGKALWETEVATLSTLTVTNFFDPSITNGLYWAVRIHLFMTMAQVNAWHYWYLITGTNPSDNEGLMGTGDIPSKRMFAVGQFSRFVRPDYYRIGASNNGSAFISAYKDTNSPGFAIVAINTNTTAINQTFNLTNFTVTGPVTPWITSSNYSLASQPTVAVGGSSFAYTLPAMSVVTFVGQGTATAPNTPPTLASVADQTINAGFTLVITNAATDTDQPPQTLTFSLPTAPNNATLTTLNNTNTVFTWRPPVSQANTTNPVSVVVIDPGSLSATNNFKVIVKPLAQPVVSSVNVSGGQVSLVVTGAYWPDYTLLASTNLTSWQALLTSNSPAIPVTLVDTNYNTYPLRFYRIQLGP